MKKGLAAVCAVLIAVFVPSAALSQTELDVPALPAFDAPGVPLPVPPPPSPIAIPSSAPLALGADDRALITRIDARVGEIVAEVEAAREAMREYFDGPRSTLTLASLYAESGAGESGPGLVNGVLGLPPADLERDPPDIHLADVAWSEGDTQRIWRMTDQIGGFYDRYIAELTAYRAALPNRPATIVQQFGVSPESLRDPTGTVLLTIGMRGALVNELLYLVRAHEAWRVTEADIVTNLLPRRQEVVMVLLARRAHEYQALAQLGARWETVWREARAPWANADYAERQEIQNELGAVYDRLNAQFIRRLDCGLAQESAANALIAELAASRIPTTMIFRNPALFVSHLGGRIFSPPLEMDGYYDTLRRQLSDLPACGAAVVIRDTPQAAAVANVAPEPVPCPECDDARVALQAAEMTLFPLLREQASLTETLSRGRDADALLRDYVTALSAAENYASEFDTQARIDGDRLTGAGSTLAFWVEVLRASYPTEEQLTLLRELANRGPVLLILAKLGMETAITDITTGVCGRRAYQAAFAIDPWSPEEVERRAASAPPQSATPVRSFDEEVRLALQSDPRMAELNAAAASAKLIWDRRFALEARKQQVDNDVAELDAERLELKAMLEDCLRQCRIRRE